MSTNFEDLIGRSNTAGKPAAGIPGRLWFDTTLGKLQRDSGVAWEDVEQSGAAASIPANGWIEAAAMTYAGADDPTFTLTITGDVSGTYQVGQRIKLTQATGGTKYFIITKVAVSGDTTLTLYGGTDYNLENEAITTPYYSPVKAPFGFPLDPTKWTVQTTDTADRQQASPSSGTWYNNAALSISIPIGDWLISYSCLISGNKSTATNMYLFTTLSTANNSESDTQFTAIAGLSAVSSFFYQQLARAKPLLIAAKITYYLNMKVLATIDTLAINGASTPTIIRAVCAYL